ncbi:MAG: hypothetical protein CMJ65_10450 [Planctomycetaceae bacterium]|jgi:hypothetical protein|nr:hypothetical protein [Planctomycetaceae bacterium]MDP7274516.1 hypothetical protein [Planctomycetaceae bacterium]
MSRRLPIVLCLLTAAPLLLVAADSPVVRLNDTMSPPAWALLERDLLRANEAACREFFTKYFDQRGFLLCVERWGGDDGPDDAIENCNDWPILHALGAHDDVLNLYKQAWEGHLRQFTLAKTSEVPFARDGMYYKEFPVTFDWVHNGEGLTVFNLQGLSDPNNIAFGHRVRRFAGFYLNEDPGAPNYDSKHKIIKSLFNGSRGPLLRKATGLDWAGDRIEVANRFSLGHGERSYQEMLDHFKDYNDIIGDHPQNMGATSLALNAYMLTGLPKYRKWLLEYVDAWRQRTLDNNGIIPTNIGLDGKIGGATDGKWYGGVYGWAFSVTVPQTGAIAHRNTHYLGHTGFTNAFMLTGDDKYLDIWRQQIKQVNAQSKVIDGRRMTPRMFGDKGWYAFSPSPYTAGGYETWYHSMKDSDRKLFSENGWTRFLEGKNTGFPESALRGDLERVRQRVAGLRADTTTPDTRLADDPMRFNPASVSSLIQLMLGGVHPGHRGQVLHARVRYFDPVTRRAGIPDGVAALVERLSNTSVTLTLVNTDQLRPKTLIIQAGGYAEHQFHGVSVGNTKTASDSQTVTVRLAPGAGGRLVLAMKRYVNAPSMRLPWDRD